MSLKLLDISKQVADFLETLPSKQFKQIYTTILGLRKNSRPHDSSKLKDSADRYRVDIGEYRVIYKFNDEIICIEIVGKRNDGEIYKKLKRLD